MRKRKEIEDDGTRKDILSLEVLLDIRSLVEDLRKQSKKRKRAGKKEDA